jgi:cytochrome c553
MQIVAIMATGWVLSAPAAAEDTKPVATAVCIACHGEDGNSVVPTFPKIAGLQESYIVKQLRDFRSGSRKNDVMTPVAAALKPEDIGPLAAYYSNQKMKPGKPGDGKAAGFGKMVYLDGNEESGVPACIGCHQSRGVGHLIYPRIGGQHAEYVAHEMKDFASGDRSNDSGRFMQSIARRMTEEEIQAVAEYLVGLDER